MPGDVPPIAGESDAGGGGRGGGVGAHQGGARHRRRPGHRRRDKLGTDLNRDLLSAALAGEGVQPVRQIAIDEVWSALRFRPA